MSSINPSRPSSAASGVKREHQSQRRSSSRASSAGAASTATRAGKRARASASERPTVNPSRVASASTQTSRSALLTLATAASGAALSTPLSRRARSVARRGSQRERNRRIAKSQVLVKSQVLASPFQTDDAPRIESLWPRSIAGRKTGVLPDALLSAADAVIDRVYRDAQVAEARLDEPRPAGERPG